MEIEVKKTKILEDADKIFSKYGIKSVTMDDLAREMGVSKKTIYQFFEDKDDLVKQVMTCGMESHKCEIKNVLEKNLNAIDESLEIFKLVMTDMKDISHNVMYDLKKYHPETYKIFEHFKNHEMIQVINSNLHKGIKEGYYREDIDLEIIGRAYSVMITTVFENADYFGTKYSTGDIYKQVFKYHISGIASKKGRKYLEENYSSMNF